MANLYSESHFYFCIKKKKNRGCMQDIAQFIAQSIYKKIGRANNTIANIMRKTIARPRFCDDKISYQAIHFSIERKHDFFLNCNFLPNFCSSYLRITRERVAPFSRGNARKISRIFASRKADVITVRAHRDTLLQSLFESRCYRKITRGFDYHAIYPLKS